MDIYELFIASFTKYKDKPAIYIAQSDREYTYGNVLVQVKKTITWLKEQGVEPGDDIGVLCSRDINQIILFLALNAAGACYVPIDGSYPRDEMVRLETQKKLIETTKKTFTDSIADFEVAGGAEKQPVKFGLELLVDLEEGQALEKRHGPLYRINSSGTMGRAKSIVIHRSTAFEAWAAHLRTIIPDGEVTQVLSYLPVSFDAHMWEYLYAWTFGACLNVASREIQYDAGQLWKFLEVRNISDATLLPQQHIRPMVLTKISETKLTVQDAYGELYKAGLRRLCITGEGFSLQLLDDCNAAQIQLINCYGQTETTFGAAAEVLKDALTIGNPVAGNYYVLAAEDDDLEKLDVCRRVGSHHVYVRDGLEVKDGENYQLIVASDYCCPDYKEYSNIALKKVFANLSIEGIPRKRRALVTGDCVAYREGLLSYQGRLAHAEFKVGGKFINPAELAAEVERIGNVRSCVLRLSSSQGDTADNNIGIYIFYKGAADRQLYGSIIDHLKTGEYQSILKRIFLVFVSNANAFLSKTVHKNELVKQLSAFSIHRFHKLPLGVSIPCFSTRLLEDGRASPIKLEELAPDLHAEQDSFEYDRVPLYQETYKFCVSLSGNNDLRHDDDLTYSGVSSISWSNLYEHLDELFGVKSPRGERLYAINTVAALFEHYIALKIYRDAIRRISTGHSSNSSIMFCLPPLTGGTQELRNFFSSDRDSNGISQQVYLLRDPGLDDPDFELSQAAWESLVYSNVIQQVAYRIAASIRQIQPKGPYHIAGWSFGGVMGLAVCEQLEVLYDADVSLYAMDSLPLQRWGQARTIEEAKDRLEYFLPLIKVRLPQAYRFVLTEDQQHIIDEAVKKNEDMLDPVQQINAFYTQIQAGLQMPTHKKYLTVLRVVQANLLRSITWNQQARINGTIYLYIAGRAKEDKYILKVSDIEAWDRFSKRGVVKKEFKEANHDTIFQHCSDDMQMDMMPFVPALQDHYREMITQSFIDSDSSRPFIGSSFSDYYQPLGLDINKNFTSLEAPTHLLMVGDALQGKTAYLHYILHKWIKRDPDFAKFRYVFFIPLIELMNFATSLDVNEEIDIETLWECVFRPIRKLGKKITNPVFDFLKDNHAADECLFLLDGFDDIVYSATGDEWFVNDHDKPMKRDSDIRVKTMFELFIKQPHVIVTTQPNVNMSMFNDFKSVKIAGFVDLKQKQDFVNKAAKLYNMHDSDRDALTMFLDSDSYRLFFASISAPLVYKLIIHDWCRLHHQFRQDARTDFFHFLIPAILSELAARYLKCIVEPSQRSALRRAFGAVSQDAIVEFMLSVIKLTAINLVEVEPLRSDISKVKASNPERAEFLSMGESILNARLPEGRIKEFLEKGDNKQLDKIWFLVSSKLTLFYDWEDALEHIDREREVLRFLSQLHFFRFSKAGQLIFSDLDYQCYFYALNEIEYYQRRICDGSDKSDIDFEFAFFSDVDPSTGEITNIRGGGSLLGGYNGQAFSEAGRFLFGLARIKDDELIAAGQEPRFIARLCEEFIEKFEKKNLGQQLINRDAFTKSGGEVIKDKAQRIQHQRQLFNTKSPVGIPQEENSMSIGQRIYFLTQCYLEAVAGHYPKPEWRGIHFDGYKNEGEDVSCPGEKKEIGGPCDTIAPLSDLLLTLFRSYEFFYEDGALDEWPANANLFFPEALSTHPYFWRFMTEILQGRFKNLLKKSDKKTDKKASPSENYDYDAPFVFLQHCTNVPRNTEILTLLFFLCLDEPESSMRFKALIQSLVATKDALQVGIDTRHTLVTEMPIERQLPKLFEHVRTLEIDSEDQRSDIAIALDVLFKFVPNAKREYQRVMGGYLAAWIQEAEYEDSIVTAEIGYFERVVSQIIALDSIDAVTMQFNNKVILRRLQSLLYFNISSVLRAKLITYLNKRGVLLATLFTDAWNILVDLTEDGSRLEAAQATLELLRDRFNCRPKDYYEFCLYSLHIAKVVEADAERYTQRLLSGLQGILKEDTGLTMQIQRLLLVHHDKGRPLAHYMEGFCNPEDRDNIQTIVRDIQRDRTKCEVADLVAGFPSLKIRHRSLRSSKHLRGDIAVHSDSRKKPASSDSGCDVTELVRKPPCLKRDHSIRDNSLRGATSLNQHTLFSSYPYDEAGQRYKVTHPALKGLVYKKIAKDGHCLFSAISEYINKGAFELRREAAEYMEDNFDRFMGFNEDANGPDRESPEEALPRQRSQFEKYIQEIRETAKWGGHLEIQAISEKYQRPIIVISKVELTLSEIDGAPKSDPIFIFYNGNSHYDVFEPEDGTDLNEVARCVIEERIRGRHVTFDPALAEPLQDQKSNIPLVL